jgi:PelA/Pel-15E family pectate lyase
MTQIGTRTGRILLALLVGAAGQHEAAAQSPPDRAAILDAMKRATTYMVDKVAYQGGYVWSYLPDGSRRWGEMEARKTMIWIQPPGTPSMGHLYLDAYHATRDEFYYRAAEQVASALMLAQHRSGGWNYLADFAGEASLREWYDTAGKNAWRLEEFQHYYGNATFDDGGTAEAAKFFLRLYLEKKSVKYKAPLDRSITFVLDSQYPIGVWPQRFPRTAAASLHGLPDYTGYATFNDDVAAENMDFLLLCYQALGDRRLLDPIIRGMNAFLVTQLGPPQAGWGLQHTLDLLPAGARTYEPKALVTHTSARNIELLVRFYRLTGETKFLARIPDALAWLEGLTLPPGIAPAGRTHATFVEVGTNRPLYVHRRGSNVVNGEYYIDDNPKGTIVHYSSFRRIDLAGLSKMYESAKAAPPEEVVRNSPLKLGAGTVPIARYFAVGVADADPSAAAKVIGSLNAQGYWLAPLGYNSHPYVRDGSTSPATGDFSETYVGDDSDTSPYPDTTLMGISIEAYMRNMGTLIRALGNPL